MSHSGDISIESNSDNTQIKLSEFLDCLYKHSWKFTFEQRIQYLPKAADDFSWKESSVYQYVEVLEELIINFDQKVPIGITAFWADSETGMDVLIYPELKSFSFGLDFNRKVLPKMDFTDFSWYLERILPVFFELKISIEFIECMDC